MASIQRRGNSYRAVIRVAGHASEIKTFRSYAEAEAWAEAREAELGGKRSKGGRKRISGPEVALPDLGLTLGQAIERYSAEVTPRKKGARQELQRLKQWSAHFLAARRLSEVSVSDLTRWRQVEEEKPSPNGGRRSPSTIRNKLNLLSAIYRHARSEWGMPDLENPIPHVRKPKQRRGRDVKLSPEQRDALLQAFSTPNRAGFLRVVTELAMLTAMRQGELLALEWEHIRSNVIHLPDTKNGDAREVPLSRAAIRLFDSWRSSQGMPSHGPVFAVTPDQLRNAFRLAVAQLRRKDSTFPHITFHDLRHVAATELSRKLSNVLELSAVTGHRSVQVLKRYYNPDASTLAAKLG